jgi:hypothetical protein
MGKIEGGVDTDIMPAIPQGVEALEDSKMTKQCANVIENKRSPVENWAEPGMLLKSGLVTCKMQECS